MHLRPEFARALERGEVLSPIEVLQANMEFYHRAAGQLLATDARVQRSLPPADHLRMRDKATDTAVALARYLHRPLAPKPYREAEDEAKAKPQAGAALISISPQADEAFRRAAAGLPPERRKIL